MERSFKNGPVVAAFVVLVSLLGYVGAYLGLGKLMECEALSARSRTFGSAWQAKAFRPLAEAEAILSGNRVSLLAANPSSLSSTNIVIHETSRLGE